MKRLSVIVIALLAIGFAADRSTPTASAQGDAGWVTLFDGKNLDHWNKIGDSDITLVDGVVQATKTGGYLVSKESYKDFEIRAEIWTSADANSGIFVRIEDPTKPGSKTAYEMNIFDTRPDPSYGTGAIVDVAKAEKVLKAGGQWNVFEISAKGPVFNLKLNGTQTVTTAKDDKHAKSGPIALQFGGGVVKFRKVQIKPL